MTNHNQNDRKIPQPDRPKMDAGYGLQSVTDYEMLTWGWVDEQMTKSRNYWIGTTKPDGKPHIAPVWGVWIDGALYFGTEGNSRKSRNLAANPHITVHLESGDEVVILEGVAEKVNGQSVPSGFGDVTFEKYDLRLEPDEGGTYYVVRHKVVLAWLEKDFLNTATRWVFGSND